MSAASNKKPQPEYAETPPGEAKVETLDTPHAKRARAILRECRETLERVSPKVFKGLERGEASPEGAASSLDEMAAFCMNMAAYFSVRSAVLRNGPGTANPILGVAGRSVRDNLVTAAAQLDKEVHTPTSWKTALVRVDAAKKDIAHVLGVLEMDGISLVSRDETPLLDGEGNPLNVEG